MLLSLRTVKTLLCFLLCLFMKAYGCLTCHCSHITMLLQSRGELQETASILIYLLHGRDFFFSVHCSACLTCLPYFMDERAARSWRRLHLLSYALYASYWSPRPRKSFQCHQENSVSSHPKCCIKLCKDHAKQGCEANLFGISGIVDASRTKSRILGT